MKLARPFLTAALVAAALPACAQWYAGASIGGSKASIDSSSRNNQLLDLGFDDASTSVDESDTAYRAHLGWRFHRNFAVEAGYGDLGRFEQRSDVLPAGSLRSSMRVTEGDLAVLGLLPLWDRWTLFGRLGAFEARTRSSFSGTGSVSLLDGAGSSTVRKSGALFGAGVMAELTPRLSARADYTYYRRLGDDLTGKLDVSTLTIGLQYAF